MSNRRRRTPRAGRTETWLRPVSDPTEALAALREAHGRRALGGIGAQEDALDALQAAVDHAQAGVDECFEKVTFTALKGDAFEELMAEHPATGDDVDDPDVTFNDAGFIPALARACGDNGWTEKDWSEEYAELTLGERQELKKKLLTVHTRTWGEQVPKG